MASAAIEPRHLPFEAFLISEDSSEIKHEYIGGEIHAMAGASRRHNLIAGNLFAALHSHLRGSPCRVFMSDMLLHLKIGQDDIGYYPDVMVTCQPDDQHDRYLTQPTTLIEVLSDSTRRTDLREKFLAYQGVPSVQEYLLVEQDTQRLTLFRRDTGWQAEHFGAGDTLGLPALGFSLSVESVYEGVVLDCIR